MKIALISENSQASKNKLVYDTLCKVANDYDQIVVNYGMFSEESSHVLTYPKVGLLAAILLNSGAADFVVTGCGTGQGAMLACNAFPGVLCGHIVDANDAFMFRQINDGNAVSLQLAKGFGWGSELQLEDIFNKLLSLPGGGGYPKERAEAERNNKHILDNIKASCCKDMLTVLNSLDRQFIKETINYPFFKVNFFEDCKDEKIKEFLRKVIEE